MIQVSSLTKTVRRLHRREGRELHLPSRPGDRLPRPQRCGQDDHDAGDGRPDAGHERGGHHRWPPLPRHPQPRPPRRRAPRRVGPARRPHRSRDPVARRPDDGPARRPASTRCSSWSASSETEAKRRLRNYSLGMKQRLGIAHALLGDPSVLILDEPANGLDPAGIRWMRGLLKGYADRGGTVLLSSHLLNEVELIADEMILIGRGEIVAQGDKAVVAGRRAGTTAPGHRARQRVARQALTRGGGLHGHRRRRRPRVETSRSTSAGSRPTSSSSSPTSGPPRAGSRTSSSPSRPTPSATPLAAPKEFRHERHRRPPPPPVDIDISTTPQVPMIRLAKVELRKALDTRAGLWFTISILALVLIVQVIYAFAAPDDATRTTATSSASPAASWATSCRSSIIMLVTSEASQRNGLVTFTLEPRRSRVVVAKFLAGFALAVSVMVLAASDRGARHPRRRAGRRLPGLERRRQPAVQRVRPRQRHRRADRLRHRDPV